MAIIAWLGLVTLGTAAAIAYFIFTSVYSYCRLRHIPGPFWARWNNLWLSRQMFRGEYIEVMDRLHRQHGPIVCLAPDFVSISDPDEIARTKKKWNRGPAYNGMRLRPGQDSLFVEQDAKRHDRLRAKFTPAFIGKDVLEGVEGMVDGHLTRLVELIEHKYISTPGHYSPMDLTKVLTYLTTDITSCMVLGHDFECLKRDDDYHGYNHSVESYLHVLSSLIVLPAFQKFMETPWLKHLDLMRPPLRPILDIAESSVAKRFGEKRAEKKDMLGSLVAQGLSQSTLEYETVYVLAAGSDTSSTAMKATILHVMSTPHVYRKLQQEIDESLASGKVTTSPISSAQAKELPYLQAVIKEGLRVFPPAAILPAASGQDEVVCGKLVPARTNVEPSLKTVARDKGVYGDDADSFRPERWLEADAEKLRAMEETSRIIWGGPGRWECLGKKIALMELDKVFFELFRRFDMVLADPTSPWKTKSCRLWVMTDMYVKLERRNARCDLNPPPV
ncbi:benzoate 4-monooxygenase cytochrome P450 [Apiospora rasikravindrae]|uniref:Benzoate 4-monooxygenase cytochrome P450 n=1 Tax=Apiospora rasikravindrae TaxID=990691 RepID=A0ABR1SJG1_9PEZI